MVETKAAKKEGTPKPNSVPGAADLEDSVALAEYWNPAEYQKFEDDMNRGLGSGTGVVAAVLTTRDSSHRVTMKVAMQRWILGVMEISFDDKTTDWDDRCPVPFVSGTALLKHYEKLANFPGKSPSMMENQIRDLVCQFCAEEASGE